MNTNHQIHLEKMIIHKVEHKTFDQPDLADLESPITPDVASFLRKHITSISNHKHTRTGCFLDDNEIDVRHVCDQLLNDPDQFVGRSQEITRHLFETIDGRMSESDLLICCFANNGGSLQNTGSDKPARWVAILKMDPNDGFVGEREEKEGLVRYVLRRVPDVLPTGELQKSALIASAATRQQLGYDLKVLDQQAARYGGHRLVASFFIKDFLRCKVGLNRKDKTKTFVLGNHDWVTRKEKSWPAEDVERFKQQTTSAVRNNVVELPAFAETVISDPDEQDEYLEYMLEHEGLEELEFEPDPEERRNLTKYAYYEGDDGLEITIERDAVGPDGTMQVSEPDETGVRTITIRTTTWSERPKRGRS